MHIRHAIQICVSVLFSRRKFVYAYDTIKGKHRIFVRNHTDLYTGNAFRSNINITLNNRNGKNCYSMIRMKVCEPFQSNCRIQTAPHIVYHRVWNACIKRVFGLMDKMEQNVIAKCSSCMRISMVFQLLFCSFST